MRTIILLLIALLSYNAASRAESKSIEDIVEKEIADACFGKTGRIEKSAIIERDLTGDGKKDLIICHEGITCSNGSRSGFCGAQVCGFNIYIWLDGSYRLEEKKLGIEVRVTDDAIPVIHWYGHGGRAHSFRWNGKEFQ